MEQLTKVIQQMNEEGLTGLTEADLKVDGNIYRVKPDWEPKAGKKRGWFALHEFITDAGERFITGSFGWFKGAENISFKVSFKGGSQFTKAEWTRFKKEHTAIRLKAENERRIEQQKAAIRAREIWEKLPHKGRSDYLQRKKVAAFSVRFSRGSIVLAVQNMTGVLSGLQFIDPEGNKKFLTGTVKRGRFFQIGDVIDPEGYMAIVEGYATGASVRMATETWPVFVAFDAGNLVHVANVVRHKYPNAKIVICGDDDFGNEDNPGRLKAEQAADKVGGVALFPVKEGSQHNE